MSEKKPAAKSAAGTSRQAQGQTPRAAQGMPGQTAATPKGASGSSTPPTNPEAGSGAVTQAAATSTEAASGVDREERVRRRAYELWEAEGRPEGREQEHWAQAEREAG